MHLEFILYNITLTDYCIVKDTHLNHNSSQHYKYGKKNNRVNEIKTLDSNTLRIYTRLYHTYQLLYRKGHIQITNSHSIKFERKVID